MSANDRNLTLPRLIAIVRRRAPIPILCVVVAVGVALGYSLSAQKQYTATASLVFNTSPLSDQIAGLQPNFNSNPVSVQDTNLKLVSLGDMARKTAAKVGHGLSARSVYDSMSFSPNGDTTVVDVASTLPSPVLAAKVANTYSRIFVAEQENGDHRYYQSALSTVERQLSRLSPRQKRGPQGLALQNRAQSLSTLAQIRTGTVSLAQGAPIPTAPSSPVTKRNVIAAGILGLLLGIALALLAERLDRNIREPSELEGTYHLPLLGAIPLNSNLRRNRQNSRPHQPTGPVAEAFQFIRARLRYFNVDRDVHTVAVVSSQPGDGKTTVAHWLANAAAMLGSRVLLIEADLRRPTMADEMGLQAGPGLADMLIGARSFDEVTQSVPLATGDGGRDERTLDVITAGGLPPNPAEMLESRAMGEVLQRARATYDFVVIDTPPLGAVSDALPLVRAVDGVVIVAQMGATRRDAAERLRQTLGSVDAPLLGVVANRVKARDSGYGYEYTYSSKLVTPDGRPTAGRNGREAVATRSTTSEPE